jgi:hypothetical protein
MLMFAYMILAAIVVYATLECKNWKDCPSNYWRD